MPEGITPPGNIEVGRAGRSSSSFFSALLGFQRFGSEDSTVERGGLMVPVVRSPASAVVASVGPSCEGTVPVSIGSSLGTPYRCRVVLPAGAPLRRRKLHRSVPLAKAPHKCPVVPPAGAPHRGRVAPLAGASRRCRVVPLAGAPHRCPRARPETLAGSLGGRTERELAHAAALLPQLLQLL